MSHSPLAARRLAVASAHLGAWPRWFPLYLDTARANATVDFFFFTDQRLPADAPANTSAVFMDRVSLERLIVEKLAVTPNLARPYKICDFKIAFGRLFEAWLAPYDAWACSDLDVLYGNLRKFITDEDLATYDLMSCREDFVTGCFSIFRNCQLVNDLFQSVPGVRELYASGDYEGVDEKHFTRLVQQRTQDVHSSFAVRLQSDRLNERNRRYGICTEDDWSYRWERGALRNERTEQEIMLFHFIDSKRHPDMTFPVDDAGKGYFRLRSPAYGPTSKPRLST